MKENVGWKRGDSQTMAMVGLSGGRQFVDRRGGQGAEASKLSEGWEWDPRQLWLICKLEARMSVVGQKRGYHWTER
jgi:hypothetical protein